MKGFGTVVTGTLVGGTISTGEEVLILPGSQVARVRGLQVHGGPAESSAAGTRTAVNLQGVEKESAPRGSVLCRPGTLVPTRTAEAFLEYLPLAPRPLRNRANVSFHAFTASTLARIILYGAAEIPPGGSGYVRINFADDMVLVGGDRFILRGFSPLENFGYTVGGGRILHPHPPARRGAGKSVPAALPILSTGDMRARTLAAIEDSGWKGMEEMEAAAVAGAGPAAVRREIENGIALGDIHRTEGGGRAWHRSSVDAIGRSAFEALSRLHDRFPEREGFPREEIASVLPGTPAPALAALALSGIPGAGKSGDLHFISARRPRSVELSSPLARAIAEKVGKAGLNALSRTELIESIRPSDPKAFDKTLDGIARAGAILKVKDLYFDPASVAALQEKLVSFLTKRGEITVPEFKELSGLTRKYLIPLLEHFDLTKVTLRVGDKRVPRKG